MLERDANYNYNNTRDLTNYHDINNKILAASQKKPSLNWYPFVPTSKWRTTIPLTLNLITLRIFAPLNTPNTRMPMINTSIPALTFNPITLHKG